jgi:hypothetical protein
MEMDALVRQAPASPRSSDRIRAHTPAELNNRIDQATMKRVWFYARQPPEALTPRIEQLDREWDIERVIEVNAGAASITGVLLSAFRRRRIWLLLPATVLSLLLQHSVTRKGLPVLVLRWLGFRTRREIEAEKYAMKMLRGDFDNIKAISEETHKALEAVKLTRL